MFKVGDKVKCVSTYGYSNRLTLGKEYIIKSIDLINNLICVTDNFGLLTNYSIKDFEKVNYKLTIEEAEHKIKELQEYIDKEKNKLCVTDITELSNEKRIAINGVWAYSTFDKVEGLKPMIILQSCYGKWVDENGFEVPNRLYFKLNK